MRRAIFYVLFACLALAAPARAQDEEPVYAPATEAHRPGRWSMQFEIGENFQLQSFDGAGLAVTHNTSPTGAWRFGVNVRGDFLDGEATYSSSTDSTVSQVTNPLPSIDDGDIGFEVLRLVRYQPDRPVGLQLGFGPAVRFVRQNVHLSDDPAPGLSEREDRNSLTTYGVTGQLGVEVLLARALSLHAHYGASAGYRLLTRTSKTTTTDSNGTLVQTDDVKQHRWTFGSEGVTMGISLYL